MSTPTDSRIQECSTCGALLDVSAEEPFALMHCPTCGAAMRVRRHFDHFEILEELGRGGMGAVYHAQDQNLHRQVALKLLQEENSNDPAFVKQFQKEAAITASINHPHVVKVYSTGKDHGRVYIAMELVDKGSLEGRMDAEEPMSEEAVLTTGIQIAQGLQAALDKGLIHRDIKPGNILFSGPYTAKIVDFGLAVLAEHAGTVAGEVWATPFYVSPETVQGNPEDFRSDLYSLGATLFHVLAGQPPHDVNTNSMNELAKAKKAPVDLLAVKPTLSSTTSFALNKALSFNPADRQQSYAEFIEHLEFARTEVNERTQAEAAQEAAAPKNYGWLTALTTAVVVAAGVGGFATYQHLHQPPPVEIAEESVVSKEKIDAKYQEARSWLAGGEATKAATEFARLDALTTAPQPLRNWITLHVGLSEQVAGRPEEAGKYFAALEQRGKFSTDFAEDALANWFVETAHQASGTTPIPPASLTHLDRENYEALGLLIFGLHDWSLGSYDDAVTLLSEFSKAKPQDRHAWVATYTPIVTPYLAEIEAWRAANATARKASTLAERQQARQTVLDTKSRLKLAVNLPAQLDVLEKDLSQKITAEEEENARRMAAAEAADSKILDDARTRIAPMWAQFRPADAAFVLGTVKVNSSTVAKKRDALRKQMEWLGRFKATLINDLNTIGYPGAISKKGGSTLPGPVKHASESQVEVFTPFGSLPATWLELTPESVIAMAKAFLNRTPEAVADRQWLLGVYAVSIGKKREGRDWLVQAGQLQEAYREELSPFLESVEAP